MVTGQRFCTICGAALDAGARFCGECGQPVRNPGPPPTPNQPVSPPSRPEPVPTPAAAGAPPLRPPGSDAASPLEAPTEVAAARRAPFPAEPRPGLAPTPVYASLFSRFLAVVLDSLVYTGVFIFAGTLVANTTDDTTRNGFNLEGEPAFLVMGITALATFAYYILMEALFGATLGKLALGIRVRSATGGPASPVAALLRNLLRIVDGIGGYLVGGLIARSSPQRQRLGDRVAGTVVVPAAGPAAARVLGLVAAVLAIAGGIGGCSLLRDPADEPVTAATPPTRTTLGAGLPGRATATNPATTPVAATATARPGATATPRPGGSPTAATRTATTAPRTATATRGPLSATAVAGPLRVTMARDVTAQFAPVEPTAVFSPTSDPIYAAFTASGAGANARVRTVWIATNVGDAAAPNTVLDEASVTLPRGNESGAFNLRQTGRPWPTGDYKVEFYVNDALVLTVPFAVQ